MSTQSTRTDLFSTVTERIVAAIEKGTETWTMPWHSGVVPLRPPRNAATMNGYRGVNVLCLWSAALSNQYISPFWAGYQQWRSLGAQVRLGEHGTPVVFAKRIESTPDEEEDGQAEQRYLRRSSFVFNSEQLEEWSPPNLLPQANPAALEHVEAFIAASGAEIRYGGRSACFHRDGDFIEMPSRKAFVGTETLSPTEAFYAVLLHELTHWTGAPDRLDREFGARFGDEAYAMEELTAELGAAFLCAALGITNEPRPDHAAYIVSWLKVLRSDPRAVFIAAGKAQRAAEYLADRALAPSGG